MIKKTYIPSKPRNPKLTQATGTSGAVGKTEFNQVAGISHEHPNKGVLDRITEAMLVGALRDLITSTDTESELTDENILSALRVLSEISKANADLLEDLKEQFLSKVEDDTAQGFIEFLRGISVEELATFTQGLEVGAFTTGALGSGAALKMVDGTSYAEVDNLTVRQKATFRELIIESLKHIGGQLVLTPARMKCVRVVDGGTFYKCYFDTGEGEVSNEFVEGDLARCQVFTGNGTKFYWRLVTLVGEDWINLSKTSAAVGSDAPEAGDDIAQLGNATDTTRQSAIILSTVGIDAPSWKQYSGINSFSLEGKETTVFSKLGNRISGETVFTSGGDNLDNYLDGVAQDILDALQAAQDAEDKAQQAIEDAEADVATINAEIGRLQDQIDGKVSNWYYAYTPTLSNYPASDWTTNEIKDAHIGDTFTNTEPAPAENAGKSWRFVKDGSTYSWIVISDSDALKALQEASKAQATADGKSTTYLFQPTKYKLGDMWVLNADHTINGTAYKQGDLLTATQDSETFVQSHWLKRVRYTDDSAVNNLEIGGRNLVLNSVERIKSLGANRITLNLTDGGLKEGTYTISFNYDILIDNNDPLIDRFLLYSTGSLGHAPKEIGTQGRASLTFNVTPARVHSTLYLYGGRGAAEGNNTDIIFTNIKLEKGNKATDWTPAPEDVEANIATAKAEAENAAQEYADIKSEAERVIAEAYADGIVSDEEQARIDDVNDKLALAKAYAEAQDALLKTQQEAYADGAISTAEQAAIDAAKDYADLKKTEAQAYADGIVSDEEARAIADALDKYNESKAYAEQLVDDIEIGGRNLLRRYGEQKNTMVGVDGIISDYSWSTLSIYPIEVTAGEKLVFSKTTSTRADNAWRYKYVDANGDFIIRKTGTANVIFETVPANATELIVSYPGDAIVKIEKGNKATDWTPAPEDVEANIETAKAEAENAANAYADTKAEAERVLAEAYADDIVTAEEQARIDDVNDKLAAAKAYAEAQDALLKTQQEAYADGKISTAEQAAIDAAKDYADAKKIEAEAYADGIVSDEEARAIADALEKYNASKAYAEQLVDDIEIGGRNLLLNSAERIKALGTGRINFTVSNGLKAETYTISFDYDILEDNNTTPITEFLLYSNNSLGIIPKQSGLQGHISFTFTVSPARVNPMLYIYGGSSAAEGQKTHTVFSRVKLEKGNKATDWTPAPEDVEANIATAKAEAENAANAYADTKAEAERVLAEAYADDIVTAEEQARIDDVNDKLAAAKAYAEAQDALLKTQQEAYADEHITTAEQAAIQAAKDYADLKKTEAQAYADGIVSDEEARAIADALAKFNDSKAHAEQLVKDIEIGGRNLLLDSGREISFSEGYNRQPFMLNLEAGTYTFSLKQKGTGFIYIYYNGTSNTYERTYDTHYDDYTEIVKTFTVKEGDVQPTRFVLYRRNEEGFTVNYKDFKLEKGNKATDWTPAPEDTEEYQGYMVARYIRSYLKGSNVNNNNTWVQIQALNKSGVNVALGKTVTASTTGSNLARITNGVTDYNNTATVSNTGKVEWVQVDLGKIYYDIDSIIHHNYWHSTPPTLADRVFNDTKIEVSTDGITWKTIFDSAVSGTYKESKEGKTFTQRRVSEEAQGFMKARFVRDWIKGNSSNTRNYWNEIKVVNKAGTNLAKGKIPTSDGSLLNASHATDGNMDNYTYISTPSTPTLNYLQIDLGAIHYDIDYIHVWHYNGVTFNSTKTEISEDGVTWKTIFDSAVEGTYVETKEGKVHTQRYASVMDRIAETEAKTRFQTLIDGGLIYTALMKLFDTISGDETAFISGKQGSGKNLPAFGAGGSYQDAIAGTAKAIIRHDGTVKFTDADIKGIINAISGKIGGLTIKDGKLLIGDVGDHRIELDASSRKMIFTAYDDFTAGSIGFDAGGAILDLFKRYTGSSAWSSSVRLDGDSFLLKKIGLSDAVTITPTKIKITNGSNTTEILDDGVYVNGVKLTGGGGGSDYVHPSTHSASMITAGTLQGIVKANNNTSYTTKQVRNMILSTGDAVSSQMANGDIWIKYE